MRKKLRFILIILILILISLPCLVLGPYFMQVQYFEPKPDRHYYAGFYLYVSPQAKRAAKTGEPVTLLVQPNNSGTNSDDPEVHRKDAWWMGFGRHRIANRLGVILLVPTFLRPAEDWYIYTHALDRDVLTTDRTDLARLDLQLLAMIEDARLALTAKSITLDEKFLLQGYSASGMFANRFAALHPKRIKAVAAGSPGGWPIAPITQLEGTILDYPAGIADLKSLTGQTFDSLTYSNIPQLIIMGALDENDSLDFGDGWDAEAAVQVDSLFGNNPLERWDDAAAIYQHVSNQSTFLLVEDVGHDRKKLQHYTTAFFLDILAQEKKVGNKK